MNVHILMFIKVALLLTVSFVLGSCNNDPGVTERNYELVWEDNFDGAEGTSPDATKWTYDIGRGQNGWGNAELQYYTDNPENVSMDGEGNLAIVSREESIGGASYTSGRIKTEGLFTQGYGRFEARIKMPSGQGLWPAFWMLGSNISTVSWPQCGEIDIMEYRGQEPTIIHGSIHGPGYSAGNAVTRSYTLTNSRYDTEFHIFSVEWGEDYIDFFMDGNLYQQITPENANGEWVYNDSPFFLILNTAVGGNYVGSPSANTTFPQTLLVDYVKVYKEVQ
ncbi:MAG: family 16 glycosylhydrolase [Bacteroidia bacterium]